jgi:excisionase family DNA binding protein
MTTDNQFLSTKEVAEILGVHQKTVHHWLRTGRLAGTKISYRAWRIPRSALEDFIEQNSNAHSRSTTPASQELDKKPPHNKNHDDIVQHENTGTSSGTGMKHYIRDIMGEDSNGQTNPK